MTRGGEDGLWWSDSGLVGAEAAWVWANTRTQQYLGGGCAASSGARVHRHESVIRVGRVAGPHAQAVQGL
jgi:hypothetical protein